MQTSTQNRQKTICRELFKEIDKLKAVEDKAYGNKDLEESGDATLQTITKKIIAEPVTKLNQVIEAATDKRQKRKGASIKNNWKQVKVK